jgi:uncharacterized damage-inducible protein DinB
MTFTESYLKELDREAITTRKMLERVPADKYDWKPHEKSMTLRQLATHLAEIPGWMAMVLNTSELDFEKNAYEPAMVNNEGELMNFFESSLANGKEQLSRATDEQMKDIWTLRNGEQVYAADSKFDTIRGCFCQVVHHRAQLGVYLRILNVPIPGSYGPSADEMTP